MSRASVARHYERIVKAWPQDPLRPTVTFQKLLQKRLEKQAPEPPAGSTTTTNSTKQTAFSEGAELRQINALYSLLDNRYSKQYPVSKNLLNPPSDPSYYHRLATELEEAPKRSFFERLMNRLKSKVRFS